MGKIFNKEIKRITVKDSVESNAQEIENIKESLSEKRQESQTDNNINIEELINKAIEKNQQQWTAALEKEKESFLKTQTESDKKYEELQKNLDKTIASKEQLEEKLKEEETARKNLEDLFKMTGNQNPATKGINFNTQSSIGGEDRAAGALKEFLDIQSKAPKIRKNSDRSGQIIAYDTTEMDTFVRLNKAHFVKDLEKQAKEAGLLQGSNKSIVTTEAPTTRTDVPPFFRDGVSSYLRTINKAGFIFWQFTDFKIEYDKGEGDVIRVPRAAYNNAPNFPNDRLLSGGGTYVGINAGNNNLSTNSVAVILNEWGLGANATYPPVMIPSFVEAYSLMDLMLILERNLLYDYLYWEDLRIRSLWAPTSRTVWNDRNIPTTTAANVGAGDFGVMSYDFLVMLNAYMKGLLIPPYMDGCYGIAMNSTSAAQLKLSVTPQWQAPNEDALRELTNIMSANLFTEGVRPTGYIGKIANFHCFESNAFGMGIVGTEGVQNDTLTAGATLTRSSYAFGANTIARGLGTAFEIRRDNNDDFQRSGRYIWLSHEGFNPLDVDPTGYADTTSVPQQLRVVKVNTTDVRL